VKVNEVYVLKNIQFKFDSYQLLPTSFVELDKLIVLLKTNPSWKIELTGHTDDQGSEDYNLTLSRQRAKSVGDYLLQNGIDRSRVRTQGFGMQRPMQSGRDEQARAVNRRVEAKFLD
jgi:outer membrane protein OmpA-like peptidoglycan-associated protein